jgi:hypothetical protein
VSCRSFKRKVKYLQNATGLTRDKATTLLIEWNSNYKEALAEYQKGESEGVSIKEADDSISHSDSNLQLDDDDDDGNEEDGDGVNARATVAASDWLVARCGSKERRGKATVAACQAAAEAICDANNPSIEYCIKNIQEHGYAVRHPSYQTDDVPR